MRTAKIIGVLLAASVALSACYGDRHGRPGSASDHHHGHGKHDRHGDRDRHD
ncbi:hypothetical protein [Sphingomonas sp. dw_22]|uniref:hypothetical protein n=1 Tax=Sphingomonas sp. dw_22 TaxID=2721175 RepID=UPI001BD426E6|nr:hypothetical protein [Sphingomonas sp. dw_22]